MERQNWGKKRKERKKKKVKERERDDRQIKR